MQASGSPLAASVRESPLLSAGSRSIASTVTDRECHRLAYSSAAHSKSMIQSKQPTQPFFTFIDHDDDLPSKRIRNTVAKKAIRSHVMRHVRFRERLAGHKRLPRRVSTESPLSTNLSSSDSTACLGDSLTVDSLVPHFDDHNHIEQGLHLVHQQRLPSPSAECTLTANMTVQRGQYLDPFDTLPGISGLSSLMNALLRYYVSVFIPMTFPTETVSFRDTRATLHTSVRNSLADTGEFYGLMTVAAAHRGTVNGWSLGILTPSSNNHHVIFDPNFCFIKEKCLQALKDKLRNASQHLDHAAIQTVIHLITSSLILGFYSEAHTHLAGLKQMVDLCGGIASETLRNSGLIHAIIWSDLKSATGSMTKPLFPLPWKPTSSPAGIMQQIRLSQSSNIGISFNHHHSRDIRQTLMDIVERLRDALLLQSFIQEQNQKQPKKDGTSGQLYQLYLFLSEIEHDLLSYPPKTTAATTATTTGYNTNSHTEALNPKETMTRMGCICLLNSIIIVTHPAAGMGRSLTRFIKRAICTFANPYTFHHQTPADLDLLAWVLFIGAQGSLEQVDHAWFIARLAHVIKSRGWEEWAEVEDVLQQYIYIPRIQETTWRGTWDKAFAHVSL